MDHRDLKAWWHYVQASNDVVSFSWNGDNFAIELIFWCTVKSMPPIGWNQGLPSSRVKVGIMSRIVNSVTDSISSTVTTTLKVPTTSFLESS